MAREPPWEQNGLPPMFSIMQIPSAKCQSARGASHQSAFMGSCLLVTRVCPVYLVDKLVLVFYGFSSMGSWCYFRKWVWNSRTKLCCMFQGSDMSAGFHSRNLIFGI